MTLERCKIRKQKADCIQQSLHRVYGLLWTDGYSVFLSSVFYDKEHFQTACSRKLGLFDDVTSVHWSSNTDVGDCYLCVVHKNEISLWYVSGESYSDIHLKKVRDIQATPLPQGCLWNFTSNALCVLTKDVTHLLWNHRTTKEIIELRSATCGCWSHDGMKLILANKSTILELTFERKHNVIGNKDYTIKESSVEGITGTVLCLRALCENVYVCTVEPSLQQICYSGDLFRAPEFNTSSDGFGRRARSHTETLFSLQPQSAHTSEIILLRVSSDGSPPIVVDKTLAPGITGLDLLLVKPETGTIVTGNGASNTIYLYNVVEHKLLKKGEISIEQDERPRGMCLASSPKLSEDILVAIVKNSGNTTEVVLPSLSLFEERSLFVKPLYESAQTEVVYMDDSARTVCPAGNQVLDNKDSLSTDTDTVALHKPNKIKNLETPRQSTKVIILDDCSESSSDIEIERVSFADCQPNFSNTLDSYFSKDTEVKSHEKIAENLGNHSFTKLFKDKSLKEDMISETEAGDCNDPLQSHDKHNQDVKPLGLISEVSYHTKTSTDCKTDCLTQSPSYTKANVDQCQELRPPQPYHSVCCTGQKNKDQNKPVTDHDPGEYVVSTSCLRLPGQKQTCGHESFTLESNIKERVDCLEKNLEHLQASCQPSMCASPTGFEPSEVFSCASGLTKETCDSSSQCYSTRNNVCPDSHTCAQKINYLENLVDQQATIISELEGRIQKLELMPGILVRHENEITLLKHITRSQSNS